MASALDPRQLLEHTDWVNTLAHRLVRDPSRAEDVAQAAYLAALEAPPAAQGNLRGWLTRVVQNLARKSGRSEQRIRHRESRAARDEALPSTSELVELAERQRELAGRVLKLSEPYRTTLLLRFYEGLSAEEIAQRSQTPVASVRTRIQRGLGQLRGELDVRYGNREAWCLAFLPLAQRGVPAAGLAVSTSLGVILMSMKWILAGAVGVVAAVVVAVWSADGQGRPELPGMEEPVSGGALQQVQEASDLERTGLPGRDAMPPAPAVRGPKVEIAPRVEIRGRVLALDSTPLANLELGWKQGPLKSKARTDSEGRYVFSLPGKDGQAELAVPDLTILAQFPEESSGDHLVFVAPAVDLRGVVVRENGEPVAGADVEWWFRRSNEAANQYILRHGNRFPRRSTESGRDGRFELKQVPFFLETSLTARKGGVYGSGDLSAGQTGDLRIVVRPWDGKAERVIAGTVRGADGLPLEGASVCFGQDFVSTRKDGSFRMALSYFKDRWTLSASKRGWQPHIEQGIAERLREPGAGVEDLQIVLQRPLPPITGVVVDAEGRACVGWEIGLCNPSDWGNSSATLEELSAESADPIWTDANGAFRIGGLANRAYRIYALQPGSMLRVESDAAWPGTSGLVLRLPQDPTVPELRVRVVDGQNQPVSGAKVQLEAPIGTLDGGPVYRMHLRGTTDADGRIVLRSVPRSGVSIGVNDHNAIKPTSTAYDAERMGTEVTIPVVRLRTLQLLASSTSDFEYVMLLDESGQVMELEMVLPGAISAGTRAPLENGALPIIRVPDTARMLVLRRGESEIRRLALPVFTGEVARIDLR
jgi:RNA polymerase sigma-70 factor (ECF subfamily)